jgi:hypothetical protein
MIVIYTFLGTIYWDGKIISSDDLFLLLLAPLSVPGLIMYGIVNWAVVGYELHNNYAFHLLGLLTLLMTGAFFLLGYRRSEPVDHGNAGQPHP